MMEFRDIFISLLRKFDETKNSRYGACCIISKNMSVHVKVCDMVKNIQFNNKISTTTKIIGIDKELLN